MSDIAYTAGLDLLASEGWLALDARILLLDAAGTYSADRDDAVLSDLVLASNEIGSLSACANYVRKTLASPAVTPDFDVDHVEGHAANVTWTHLGGVGPTVGAAVVFFQVTDDTDSVPFLHFDSVFPRTLNGQDLTLQFNLEGLFTITDS